MSHSRRELRVFASCLAAGLLIAAASASFVLRAAWAADPAKRAAPPTFDKSVRDAFFPDAREKLIGPRPQARAGGETPNAAPTTSVAGAPSGADAGSWSRLIAADAVEDEIKAQQIRLLGLVQNPTRFKGGEFQAARQSLSVLAAMLGVVTNYDGRIRWQDEAAAIRNRVARAGQGCKVGTDESYREAKAAADDLQLLVRGGSPPAGEASDLSWPEIAARGPLMQRLEQAQQQGIAPLTANADQFQSDAARLAHEAQVVAALAEVITREGYEFADDETYLEYARDMQNAALEVRDATRRSSYEDARRAAGRLGQSCTTCHEGYRS